MIIRNCWGIQIMNNKAELLKKLKALVDRGIDGEKVSAEKS